jgi:hypothetical protein
MFSWWLVTRKVVNLGREKLLLVALARVSYNEHGLRSRRTQWPSRAMPIVYFETISTLAALHLRMPSDGLASSLRFPFGRIDDCRIGRPSTGADRRPLQRR